MVTMVRFVQDLMSHNPCDTPHNLHIIVSVLISVNVSHPSHSYHGGNFFRAIPYPPLALLNNLDTDGLPMGGSPSPKRLSLDERLEKELGIKVRMVKDKILASAVTQPEFLNSRCVTTAQ